MGGRGKVLRRATIAATVAGLCTPVAASAAVSSGSRATDKSTVIHVSEQDANKTFNVTKGTRIVVDLHGSYDQPTVDHTEVLKETAQSGGYPTKTDATATFKAISLGNATITSRLDSDCMHPAPGRAQCMMMPAPLNINIVVDKGILPPPPVIPTPEPTAASAPTAAPTAPPSSVLARLALPILGQHGR